MAKSKYPEHDKLSAIQDRSQTVGGFLEWLMHDREPYVQLMVAHSREVDEDGEHVYRNAEDEIVDDDWYPPNLLTGSKRDAEMEERRIEEGIERRLVPDPNGRTFLDIRERMEDLLAEYFEIDQEKLEDEKRAMLDAMREVNEQRA